jgi:GT2 family glycosyltransferase
MNMTLAVVILNWNQTADTINCVRAARSWPLEAEHIWVVDNASQQGETERLARECPGVRLICSEVNRGFAGGNNLALARILTAGYDAVLLLNNDALADAAAIGHLRSVLESRPDVGIAGPQLWDAQQHDRLLSAGGRDIAHHIVSHIRVPVPPGEWREVDYVPGTCVLIRLSVLRLVGLLDEDFFFGGELAALCKTVGSRGFRSVISGNANVYHSIVRSSSMRASVHLYYVIRNRYLFARKFYPSECLKLYVVWTLFAFYSGLHAILHRQFDQARAIGLGCLDGWLGRVGGHNARVTRGLIH